MEMQGANRQHPIPQNVMDVEFKLVGELTVRQFSYLLFFSMIIIAILYSPIPLIFQILFIPIFTILGLAIAFYPLGDRSLDKWIVNYFKALKSPRTRVWKSIESIPDFLNFRVKKTTKTNTRSYVKKIKKKAVFAGEVDEEKLSFESDEDIQQTEKNFLQRINFKEPEQLKNPNQSTNIVENEGFSIQKKDVKKIIKDHKKEVLKKIQQNEIPKLTTKHFKEMQQDELQDKKEFLNYTQTKTGFKSKNIPHTNIVPNQSVSVQKDEVSNLFLIKNNNPIPKVSSEIKDKLKDISKLKNKITDQVKTNKIKPIPNSPLNENSNKSIKDNLNQSNKTKNDNPLNKLKAFLVKKSS